MAYSSISIKPYIKSNLELQREGRGGGGGGGGYNDNQTVNVANF